MKQFEAAKNQKCKTFLCTKLMFKKIGEKMCGRKFYTEITELIGCRKCASIRKDNSTTDFRFFYVENMLHKTYIVNVFFCTQKARGPSK